MLILIFVSIVIIVIFGNIELLEHEARFALIGYFLLCLGSLAFLLVFVFTSLLIVACLSWCSSCFSVKVFATIMI